MYDNYHQSSSRTGSPLQPNSPANGFVTNGHHPLPTEPRNRTRTTEGMNSNIRPNQSQPHHPHPHPHHPNQHHQQYSSHHPPRPPYSQPHTGGSSPRPGKYLSSPIHSPINQPSIRLERPSEPSRFQQSGPSSSAAVLQRPPIPGFARSVTAGASPGREGSQESWGWQEKMPQRSATDPASATPPLEMQRSNNREWRQSVSESDPRHVPANQNSEYFPSRSNTPGRGDFGIQSSRPSVEGGLPGSQLEYDRAPALTQQQSQSNLSSNMDRLRIVAPSSSRHSPSGSPTSSLSPHNVPLPGSDTSHSHSGHNGPARTDYSGAQSAVAGPSKPLSAAQTYNQPPTDTQSVPRGKDGRPKAGGGVGGAGGGADQSQVQPKQSSTSLAPGTMCAACGKTVKGQFVRAMGRVYHLDCFRCKDCDTVVATKFFPVEDADGSYPLCERDYFARLSLICAKCDKALRGSYITACGKKYHVDHFTCSVCPTIFGPQDSYYEHDDEVYCHFHYSTRFAVKCVGCANAILKQFVEINRNGKDECWHPECYMIHKFWNVKLTSVFQATPANSHPTSSASSIAEGEITPEEEKETPESLRANQQRMEARVDQIWNVLSAFEESSAACISEMLRHVSGGQYSEAILMAEKFIFHVEALFAAVDDLEARFAEQGAKGVSHAREAKMLCRKTVNFFSLLSRTQDSREQKTVTQELLALVTGLAHYLKILIRIALTSSLKLEREHGVTEALDDLLLRLLLLAKDDGNPLVQPRGLNSQTATGDEAPIRVPPGYTPSTKAIAYGYRSLAIEVMGETPLRGRSLPNQSLDNCMRCRNVVDEDCIRLGLFERWHGQCLQCDFCNNAAATLGMGEGSPNLDGSGKSRVRTPIILDGFSYETRSAVSRNAVELSHIACGVHRGRDYIAGFDMVSRLEQYSYLLNVALRELYSQLHAKGFVVEAPPALTNSAESSTSLYAVYRDSADIKRLKSVNLDRKLSATARIPQRSTIVESPSGKTPDNIPAHAAPARPLVPDRSFSQAVSIGGGDSIISAPPTPVPSNYSQANVPGTREGSPRLDVLRPAFARNNTSVRILNEDPTSNLARNLLPLPSNQTHSPLSDEEGVTLADIPSLLEAEQARLERRSRPAHEGRPLLSDLSPLEAVIIKHFALLGLQKTALAPIIDLDDMWELVEVKRNAWWNKFRKGGRDKKDVKRKGTFGVPLEILVEKTGSDTQLGSTEMPLRVPEFIDNVISAMKQMDMSIEGIFRKNGNIKRLNSVSEALDKDASSVVLSEDNPVQLAALLKKFLRDLPDPLLTFKLHKLFTAAQHIPDDKERLRCLHLCVCMLPRYNRDTMEVLFVFLKWVASFAHVDEETGSKMDVQNLATVICPSILYAKGSNALRDDSFIAIKAVQALVEHQDEFYPVPAELLFVLDENVSAVFASSIDLPPKEIFKHCTNYSNARRGPRNTVYVAGTGKDGKERTGEIGNLTSQRSDANLAQTSSALAQGRRAASPGPLRSAMNNNSSRPSSWVDLPTATVGGGGGGGGGGGSSHNGNSNVHFQPQGGSNSSILASSPKRFQGHFGGRRGSVSSSLHEGERRPSSSVERVNSPKPQDRTQG